MAKRPATPRPPKAAPRAGTSRGAGDIAYRTPGEPKRKLPRLVLLLVVPFVIVIATLIALEALGVTLGQGSFFYRYSPIYAVRLGRTWPVIPLIGAFVAGLWLATRPARGLRSVGAFVCLLTMLLLGVWTWWAPPRAGMQHTFNFVSPSHDGAFVLEAASDPPLTTGQYLRTFDERLKLSTEQMRGTRVLSNPPGMTVVTKAISRNWPAPGPGEPMGWIDHLSFPEPVEQVRGTFFPPAVRAAFVLHVLWVVALVPAYGLSRLFLPPAGAAVAALVMWFNPSSVLFAPGKDPAQLLTTCAMLWAFFAAGRASGAVIAALLATVAGALLAIALTLGLIHLWIAMPAAAAVAWHAWSATPGDAGRGRALTNVLFRQLIPAAIGAMLVVGIVQATIGWNIAATLLAVQQRWREIQGELKLSHATWMLIGLPIFLLFVSPALYALLALNLRRFRHPAAQRPGHGFGRRLLICTAVSMGLTYVIGIPYELPRLWVVFLPPLVLGAALDLPLFHADHGGRRAFAALALIASVHVLFTAMHWSRFDVRESEYRMISQRLWM